MEEETTKDKPQVSAGEMFLKHIQDTLKAIDGYIIAGEWFLVNSTLNTIYPKVLRRLTPEEKTKITEQKKQSTILGAEVGRLRGFLSIRDGHSSGAYSEKEEQTPKHKWNIAATKYQDLLEQYQISLMAVLDRLGWLIPQQENKKRPR